MKKKITYERNRLKYLVEYYSNGIIKSEGGFTQIKTIPKKEEVNQSQSPRRSSRKTTGSLRVKNGEWQYFNRKGKLIKKENYLNGKLIQNGM
ncbi:MAG: hypothetical protein IPJ02_08545 [Chitinophagaceae bacterium]|nr:hypothetical protein [Chitinophagaceae bacterium]